MRLDGVEGTEEDSPLRQELKVKALTDLIAKAEEEGVEEAQRKAALDSDQPKAELVELIVARRAATDQAVGARTSSLRRLGPSSMHTRSACMPAQGRGRARAGRGVRRWPATLSCMMVAFNACDSVYGEQLGWPTGGELMNSMGGLRDAKSGWGEALRPVCRILV